MRKPHRMTTREYVAIVNKINSYLTSFPPFGPNQQFPEDEVLDLLELGMPAMWQGERPQEDYGATGNNNCLLVFQPQETQSLDDDIRNLSNSNSWKRLILTNSDFLHFY